MVMKNHAIHSVPTDMSILKAAQHLTTNYSIQKQLVSSIDYLFYVILLNIMVLILVSRPSPQFEGTAVVNGEFTQISLSDYFGKYVVFFFYPLDL